MQCTVFLQLRSCITALAICLSAAGQIHFHQHSGLPWPQSLCCQLPVGFTSIANWPIHLPLSAGNSISVASLVSVSLLTVRPACLHFSAASSVPSLSVASWPVSLLSLLAIRPISYLCCQSCPATPVSLLPLRSVSVSFTAFRLCFSAVSSVCLLSVLPVLLLF